LFYLQSVPCSLFLDTPQGSQNPCRQEQGYLKKTTLFGVNGISSDHRCRDRGKPAQHGVLPSLAGGELLGRCDFCCVVMAVHTTCPGRSCSSSEILAIPAAGCCCWYITNVFNRTSSLLQSHIADRPILFSKETHAFSLVPPLLLIPNL